MTFSVKMRLGQESEEEGLRVMPIINEMPLLHVTLHPRLGKQQYKGTIDREAILRFIEKVSHLVIYNGDICEWPLSHTDTQILSHLQIKGVMIGRGLLARPWMLSDKAPHEVIRNMHAIIYRHATEHLCGDSQILSRLHAFWDYLDIDRKQKKAIMKATTLRRYNEAVAVIFRPGAFL